MSEVEDDLERLRQEFFRAKGALQNRLRELCGPEHHYVQHRDGRPPWCDQCRRASNGVRVPKRFSKGNQA